MVKLELTYNVDIIRVHLKLVPFKTLLRVPKIKRIP